LPQTLIKKGKGKCIKNQECCCKNKIVSMVKKPLITLERYEGGASEKRGMVSPTQLQRVPTHGEAGAGSKDRHAVEGGKNFVLTVSQCPQWRIQLPNLSLGST
jgi:hypothetical protein